MLESFQNIFAILAAIFATHAIRLIKKPPFSHNCKSALWYVPNYKKKNVLIKTFFVTSVFNSQKVEQTLSGNMSHMLTFFGIFFFSTEGRFIFLLKVIFVELFCPLWYYL